LQRSPQRRLTDGLDRFHGLARGALHVGDVRADLARDFAVWPAKFLTSWATTAKPRPASPARAASIVALSARRLICSAIDLIRFTGIWTMFNGDRGTKSMPVPGPHQVCRRMMRQTDASGQVVMSIKVRCQAARVREGQRRNRRQLEGPAAGADRRRPCR
jgi:hypothetical protein